MHVQVVENVRNKKRYLYVAYLIANLGKYRGVRSEPNQCLAKEQLGPSQTEQYVFFLDIELNHIQSSS